MHRGHIIADEPIPFFPTVPQSHPPIMQETVQDTTHLSRIWGTLDGNLCWSKIGFFLRPGLMVAQAGSVMSKVILNQRQSRHFGLVESGSFHCPGQCAEIVYRVFCGQVLPYQMRRGEECKPRIFRRGSHAREKLKS